MRSFVSVSRPRRQHIFREFVAYFLFHFRSVDSVYKQVLGDATEGGVWSTRRL